MLRVVEDILGKIDSEKIQYCHWKSNIGLKEELNGGELDLHVPENFRYKFEKLIKKEGFLKAHLPLQKHMSGVEHYYGIDINSGKLQHLHVFFSILTGESILKNHKFNISSLLLSGSEKSHSVRIPPAEVEFCLFVIRTFLKYNSILETILLLRENGKIVDEANYIENRCKNIKNSEIFLKKYFNGIPKNLILNGMQILKNRENILKKYLHARKLNKFLRSFKRFGLLESFFIRFSLFTKLSYQKFIIGKKSKTLCSKGFIFALSGAEASGKSTLLREIKTFLKNDFLYFQYHLGKPGSNILTFPFNLLAPFFRKIFVKERNTHKIKNQKEGESISSGLIYSFRSVLIAYDRYRLSKRVHSKASKGAIVLCDRWPSSKLGAMDSPRIRTSRRNDIFSKIIMFLSNCEKYFYSNIKNPDLVVYLDVSASTAIKRNASRFKKNPENSIYVSKRHSEESRPDFSMLNNCSFDTNTDLEISKIKIKNLFWTELVKKVKATQKNEV